jgi:hypothetical protein
MRKRLRGEKLPTIKQIETLAPGWYALRVLSTGSTNWIQRLTLNGRRVNRGLG